MPRPHNHVLSGNVLSGALLTALLGVALGPGCRGGEQATSPSGKETGLFLAYEQGGGMDMYSPGDHYGHRIEIDSGGSYVLYERIYRETREGRSIRNRQISQAALEEKTLDTLKKKVQALRVSELPSDLPVGGPAEVELMEPAETVSLSLSPGSAEEQSVRAHMGAAPEHYPEEFLRLHRFLRQLIRAKREQISG